MLRNFSQEKYNKMSQVPPQSAVLELSLGTGKKDSSSRDKTLRQSLGFTRKDWDRNEKTRNIVKVGGIAEKMQETRLRCLGHVLRRDNQCVGK